MHSAILIVIALSTKYLTISKSKSFQNKNIKNIIESRDHKILSENQGKL